MSDRTQSTASESNFGRGPRCDGQTISYASTWPYAVRVTFQRNFRQESCRGRSNHWRPPRRFTAFLRCLGVLSGLVGGVTPAWSAPTSTKPSEAKSSRPPVAREPAWRAARIGAGVALFGEQTERKENFQQPLMVTDVPTQERVSEGLFNFQLWALFPFLTERLHLGAGVAWYNAYSLEDPDEDDDDAEAERYGHMFQLFAKSEYTIPEVVARLNVLVGLRFGAIALFPSGDFSEELDAIDAQDGFDIWNVPRVGAFVGPHLGASWPLNERIVLRSDVGVQFTRLWLFNVEAEDQGVTTSRQAWLGTTRLQWLLGLEFAL